mmetsp:Transcript_2759/g.3162  ORF Transcript_2759/g.3162 Transcript_2759/m.3162 type:complete len:246 (-) Transcript_2759:102-839(-)
MISRIDIGYDCLFKVVLLGDTGVGKTSLSSRFTRDEFSIASRNTVGVEFAAKTKQVNGKLIKTHIWDTAGNERFRSKSPRTYYQGAAAAIIVYDISKRKSFENVQDRWLRELEHYAEQNIRVMLIGSKADLDLHREVSKEEAEEFSHHHNMTFIETSALASTNVDEAFQQLLAQTYRSGSTQTKNLPPQINSWTMVEKISSSSSSEIISSTLVDRPKKPRYCSDFCTSVFEHLFSPSMTVNHSNT